MYTMLYINFAARELLRCTNTKIGAPVITYGDKAYTRISVQYVKHAARTPYTKLAARFDDKGTLIAIQ